MLSTAFEVLGSLSGIAIAAFLADRITIVLRRASLNYGPPPTSYWESTARRPSRQSRASR